MKITMKITMKFSTKLALAENCAFAAEAGASPQDNRMTIWSFYCPRSLSRPCGDIPEELEFSMIRFGGDGGKSLESGVRTELAARHGGSFRAGMID
jgi:hypothetical protein